MKYLIAAAFLAGLLALPAQAAIPPGGISGYIVDQQTGRAMAGIPLEVYRMPVVRGDAAVAKLTTNKRGYFVDTYLPEGRYLIVTVADGRSFGCAIDEVFDTGMTHMRLGVGESNSICYGPHVHAAVVNPALTSDLYVIR